jgi:Na+/H+ antiporter NhaD/arsenite permease-like protein
MSLRMILALSLFVVSFILISTEKINKTLVAIIAAMLFISMGLIDQQEAFYHVDWNVIFLLIGMMIIVGITKNTGLFQYIAIWTAKAVKGDPVKILIALAMITAVLSAMLDNVTTILIITPVSILIAVELGISPAPFVISNAIASNIGGTATLIGDPPNIMIGSAVGLSFMDFLVTLGPVVLLTLLVLSLLIFLFFRKQLQVSKQRRGRIMEFNEALSIKNKPLLIKSLSVLSLVFIGFLLHELTGIEPATVSLFGAAVLMLISGAEEVEEFFHEVEWTTIFFFIGLFVLVGTLEELGIIEMLAGRVMSLTRGDVAVTSIVVIWMSGVLSALVDNIPYVATMIPLVENMGETMGAVAVMPIWWSLALGSCFGGNGSLIGASANVVGAGISARSGYKISFLQFTKYGVVVTFVSLLISTAYIYLFVL